jgi:hypothetical protein
MRHRATGPGWTLNDRTRAYLYRIVLAGAPLCAVYGIVTADRVPLWLGLAGAVLGNGMAAVNTSTKAAP